VRKKNHLMNNKKHEGWREGQTKEANGNWGVTYLFRTYQTYWTAWGKKSPAGRNLHDTSLHSRDDTVLHYGPDMSYWRWSGDKDGLKRGPNKIGKRRGNRRGRKNKRGGKKRRKRRTCPQENGEGRRLRRNVPSARVIKKKICPGVKFESIKGPAFPFRTPERVDRNKARREILQIDLGPGKGRKKKKKTRVRSYLTRHLESQFLGLENMR